MVKFRRRRPSCISRLCCAAVPALLPLPLRYWCSIAHCCRLLCQGVPAREAAGISGLISDGVHVAGKRARLSRLTTWGRAIASRWAASPAAAPV